MVHVDPYVRLLRAVIRRARLDQQSKKQHVRQDADAFFARGGGEDQWMWVLRRVFHDEAGG